MIILGLTGSIGMGKSTVSGMFRNAGIPVWDADAQVHKGYDEDNISLLMQEIFPEGFVDGVLNRKIISDIVFDDKAKMTILSNIWGEYLEVEMSKFIANARWVENHELIVLDIPLLFESRDRYCVSVCDYVAVVYCSAEEQKARVLKRPEMTEERLERVLANQMSSDDKMKSADILIDTSATLLDVRDRVAEIIENIHDQEWV